MDAILKMQNITKQYPAVLANDNVDLIVEKQSIHAIIGENGAGKSTLMNILCGMTLPDSGQIVFNDNEVNITSPFKAISLGIGMVHQHFMLVNELTVLENIVLGAKVKTRFGLTDYGKLRQDIQEILDKYEFQLDLNKYVQDLSAGEMQRVEIIKMLYRGADLLILDEPTAVLTPQETLKLFEMMKNLVQRGKTVLFITHKLKEIMAISSRVTVMRGGKVTGNIETKDANEQLLASMMVGRDVVLRVEKQKANAKQTIIKLKDVCADGDRGLQAVNNVNFEVKSGEIVGIAGVDGNGQNELVEVLTGLRKSTKGNIYLKGEDISSLNCLKRRRAGISHIPGDRMVFGINKVCSIYDNLILNDHNKKEYCTNGIMKRSKLLKFSNDLIKEFGVAAANCEVAVGTLSGGNMQKVVIAREMAQNPEFLMAVQPTRGVDVGAIEFIHKQIIKLRDKGKAVLLISVELDEVLSLSDRVLVMYEGEIVAEFSGDSVDELEIGMCMAGAKRKEVSQ